MSTNRTDYVMWAVPLKELFPTFHPSYDNFEAEYDGAPGALFQIVNDGMSGNYCWAGQVITVSDIYEGFTDEVDILIAYESIDKFRLAKDIAVRIGIEIFPADFRLVAFSHFS